MSAVPVTTLRESLATALRNDGVWNTFSYPPATIVPQSVIIAPSDPYLAPSNNLNAVSPEANFKVIMTVPALDNQGNLAQLEEMMSAVYTKLQASGLGINVGTFSAPGILSVASGDLLSADLTISLLTEWT